MDIHRLIKQANNIAAFFASEPDPEKGARGIADHIRNFWDPRMRREMLAHFDQANGEGLHALALQAIRAHRSELV